MLFHPLLLTILICDCIAGLLALAVGLRTFRIAVHWNPAVADRTQLSLEGQAETAGLLGQWVLGLLFFSTLLLVIAISNVLPGVVPGAMCGTGVMQAMGDAGRRTIFFRLLAVLFLFVWLALHRINTTQPEAPLTQTGARLWLAALPASFCGLFETLNALRQIDVAQPVSCCAMVYDQFHSLQEARSAAGLPESVWLAVFLTGAMALLWVAWRTIRPASPDHTPVHAWLAVICAFWIPVAAVTLVRQLAAYHYGVLQHHCPWCLFLADYRLVGYALYGALALMAFEALVVLWLPHLARPSTAFAAHVARRIRTAALRVMGATAVFLLLTVLPAVYWRLRYGVWLH